MSTATTQVPGTIPSIDLRKISRNPETCNTIITLDHDNPSRRQKWIELGQVSFRKVRESESGSRYEIKAYARSGATDHEHDSAHILGLPVIGLTFLRLNYQQAEFEAWVDPNLDLHIGRGLEPDGFDQFLVPNQDYNPFKNAKKCSHCKGEESHVIVPFLPPNNRELYEKVKGRKIIIQVGPVFNDISE